MHPEVHAEAKFPKGRLRTTELDLGLARPWRGVVITPGYRK
jgi:hypothetical protein